MQCRPVRTRLVAFQDDELSPRERARVQAHLARCSACARLDERLAAVTPDPFLHLDPRQEQALWERLDAALAPELARMPRVRPRSRWEQTRDWLTREAHVPAGALLAYGTLLVIALSWGTQSWRTSQQLQVEVERAEAGPAWAESAPTIEIPPEQYRPAVWVPDDRP